MNNAQRISKTFQQILARTYTKGAKVEATSMRDRSVWREGRFVRLIESTKGLFVVVEIDGRELTTRPIYVRPITPD